MFTTVVACSVCVFPCPLVPLLEQYQTLAEQYEHILDQQEDQVWSVTGGVEGFCHGYHVASSLPKLTCTQGANFLPDVKHTVCDILRHAEQASFANADINSMFTRASVL